MAKNEITSSTKISLGVAIAAAMVAAGAIYKAGGQDKTIEQMTTQIAELRGRQDHGNRITKLETEVGLLLSGGIRRRTEATPMAPERMEAGPGSKQ